MNRLDDTPKQPVIIGELPNFNWEEFARSLGTIRDFNGGFQESVEFDTPYKALAKLIDDSFIQSAVHAFVTGIPGGELARSILQLLRHPAAVDEVRRILQEAEVETRSQCARLLGYIGGRDELPDVARLLSDEDEGVRSCALDAIDVILFAGRTEPEEIEPYLITAENDRSDFIREKAKRVRCWINENKE